MASSDPSRETMPALRVAAAVAICLVCCALLQVNQAGLAVWSTFMVMVQYSFTSFQKGIERVLGRGLGILIALVLATLTRNAWGLGFVLEMLAIVPLFYLYFSDRLAYTFLNAGLYLAVVMNIARTEPAAVVPQATDLWWAIVVGVVVAELVTWLSSAEHDLAIRSTGQPLWPVDADRLRHSVMLMLTVALAHVASYWLELSTSTALVSVMLLTITPDFHALLRKGELRLEGALLAILFAGVAIILLIRIPSFPLQVLLLFLGTFLATKLARTSVEWGYAGVQMGLVLPMILVVPQQEFGSLSAAFSRVGGALLAIASSLIVGFTWAALFPSPPLSMTPAPSTPPADTTSQSPVGQGLP